MLLKHKKFIVYMHIFPNGKKYIGITSKSPNARWEGGTGYSQKGQPIMYNAIQKYGWENVKHIILYENLSYEEAHIKERELIEKHKTYTGKYGTAYGYNMTQGGEGTPGHICTSETKEKMSKIRTGKYAGDDCYKSKAVTCKGVRYSSITDFCKQNNLGRGMVEKWLLGKSKMPKEWIDKGLQLEGESKEYVCQEKPWCYQIQYDGKIFETQAAFARYINVSPSLVCRWIKNNKVPDHIKQKGFKRIEDSI